MNFKLVFKLAGKTLLVAAACMVLPLLVTLLYREDPMPFLSAMGITALAGLLLSLLRADTRFNSREGFFSAGLIWLLVGFFGALPFQFSGYFPSFVDCLFESISGFTTTGASILTAVEPLPKGILFWRSFIHWLGGMGILVLTIALLPSLGARTLHVMKAESPGPIISKLVPKSSQSSKILYGIYFALTVLEVVFLLLGGMPLFESLLTSFGTTGTGGFGFRNDSFASFSPAIQNTVTTFMILSGINYTAYFYILTGKIKELFKIEEVRWYLAIIFGSVAVITWNVRSLYPTFSETLRHAFFQVGSIITTTGYATTDFDLWPALSKTLLVTLMFIGACAGSTGGGIKVSRIVIYMKSVKKEMAALIHPRSVKVTKLEGKVVDDTMLRSVFAFLSAYLVIFVISLLVVSLDGFDLETNFSAVAATFNNIGPGLGAVGPVSNFSAYSVLSKIVLSLDMLIGRLEIFPILLLFAPSTWKK